MDEIEEPEEVGIRSFVWFVKPEDIYSEEVELPSTKEEEEAQPLLPQETL